MIGWLKLDKDMIDDPRVMEVAAQLRDVLHLRVVHMWGHSGEDLENTAEVTALRCVTLGALVTLWRYAHDHINEQDVLRMGLDTLDTVVGIEGFCALLPAEWLVKLDEVTTKLPGYCAKNGLIGKEKAASNNAERQARWRVRHKGESKSVSAEHKAERNTKNNGVTSNGVTHTDQDQDQDQDIKKELRPSDAIEHERSTAPAVREVFEHWQQEHHHPQARLDQKRRRCIVAALQQFTPEQLCQAISGYLNSPHHMGTSPGGTGTKYDDVALFLRDAAHVEAGLQFFAHPPRPPTQESEYDRLMRLNGSDDDRVIQHEPDTANPLVLPR